MARDGSGNYSRTHADYVSGATIESSAVNGELNDFASEMTNSLAKNGETVPTANLPMGGYKHTGVANASARTNYAAAGQVADNSLLYAVDTGSADAYTIAPSPGISAYAIGQRFTFKVINANLTTTPTLAVNGLTAGTIKWPDNSALVAGDLPANALVEVVVSATTPVFHLQTVAHSTGTGAVVRATSPTLVTPALGTPSAIDLTNATNLPAAQRLSSKIITLTRDLTASSGSVGYTGAGFTPTSIIFMGSVGSNVNVGWAMSDSSKTVAGISDGTNFNHDTTLTVGVAGANQAATISSYDADGFTLSWTKTGAPNGTATIYALCFR